MAITKKCEKARKPRKLIVVGQSPPPFHGQAVAIQQMVDGLRDRIDLVHVPMRFSDQVSDNGRVQWRKVTSLVSVIVRTVVALMRYPGAVLYFPPAPASWVPIVRDALILAVCRPLAAKTIFHFHAHGLGDFLVHRRFGSLLRIPWAHADEGIVLGASCIKDTEMLGPKRISIIPYGTAMKANIPFDRVATQRVRILYVGMLAESKGLFDLLDTASRMTLSDNIDFNLVGTFQNAETEERFLARRKELNLEQRVHLCGQKTGDNLLLEYQQADIFFFPTFYESETFGIVTVEAMAHSLPIVASNWRGPKDIVVHGETGILCEPRDAGAFCEALRFLADRQDIRAEMGSKGYQRFRNHFEMSMYLEGLEKAFLRHGCSPPLKKLQPDAVQTSSL